MNGIMFDFTADPATRLRQRYVASGPYGTVVYSPPAQRHSLVGPWAASSLRCRFRDKRGGDLRRSACALTEHDHPDGLEQNQDIEQQRMVLDIVEIVLELLDGFFHVRAVGIAHLRPTGYA